MSEKAKKFKFKDSSSKKGEGFKKIYFTNNIYIIY